MPTGAFSETVQQVFDQRLAAWEIALPADSRNERRRESIVKNGWTINYQSGAAHGIEYREYFASHRMTNDTLNRIYADGRENCSVLARCSTRRTTSKLSETTSSTIASSTRK